MDHSQAIETQAAERYLLGELSASEAEDFEQHYFECTDCAEAVESGGAFIANARAVLGRPSRLAAPASPPVPRKPFRFLSLRPQWAFALASAAALAFAGVALYEGASVIPRLEHLLENPPSAGRALCTAFGGDSARRAVFALPLRADASWPKCI